MGVPVLRVSVVDVAGLYSTRKIHQTRGFRNILTLSTCSVVNQLCQYSTGGFLAQPKPLWHLTSCRPCESTLHSCLGWHSSADGFGFEGWDSFFFFQVLHIAASLDERLTFFPVAIIVTRMFKLK